MDKNGECSEVGQMLLVLCYFWSPKFHKNLPICMQDTECPCLQLVLIGKVGRSQWLGMADSDGPFRMTR